MSILLHPTLLCTQRNHVETDVILFFGSNITLFFLLFSMNAVYNEKLNTHLMISLAPSRVAFVAFSLN